MKLDSVWERFRLNAEAMQALKPYGLTSAEAVLPHYVAGREALLERLRDTPVNSLEFPRYEFFYPWEYAYQRQTQFIENHAFIIELKQAEFVNFMAGLDANSRDKARMLRTLGAEYRYLTGFQKFLEGISLEEQYRIFDDALAVAPWNDSLRARIYLQYRYSALTRTNPGERSRLMKKAEDLYRDH
jgi:hypothetical protein